MTYEPLDYDRLNRDYIYSIENGRRLIDDYGKLIRDLMAKLKAKIAEADRETKLKQFEKLKKELEV